MEDGSQSFFALEQEGCVPGGSGRIQKGRRPRVEHGGRLLRSGAPRRRGWKRGAQSQCIGRSRGGLTTKIHALVDGLGNPLHVHLSAGNIHDVTEAPKLVEAAEGRNFIGDKGYDSNAVIEAIEAKGMTAVIPSNASRSQKRQIDGHLYKERHLVENFFCKLKRYRRVATRYEKTAVNFLGFVLFASLRVWLA